MENKEEEIRFRGKEDSVKSENKDSHIQELKNDNISKAKRVVQSEKENVPYNVEKDPRYRCLFIMLKIVIAILFLICLAIVFFNWIAPHLVSTEHKIEYLRERLMNSLCEGECTDKDYEDIENIIKRVRNEM